MKPLTLPALRERAAYWQNRLALRDWEIKLGIGRMHALGDGTLGETHCHSNKRQAKVNVLDPRDVDGQGFWFDGEVHDWEITLVHELLHLHFHDVFPRFPHKKPAGIAAERMIDAVAKALVALDRKKRR